MSNVLIDGILFAWNFNRDYANRLLADLSDEQMVVQPQPGMNHPAWTLSHLNAYHPVILQMLRGEKPEDPLDHPFGQKSRPVADVSAYPSKQTLLEAFNRGHDEIAVALRDGGDAALMHPMPIERWKTRWDVVGKSLPYLMMYHESTHLGQLSAWRRVQGLPSV